MKLYKTGEVDRMGRDVYRQLHKRPSRCTTRYVLTGEYFVGDGFHENVYKDEEGSWRSERGGILSSRDQCLLDRGLPTGQMYAVGSAYKGRHSYDSTVWNDGEPAHEVTDFEIVKGVRHDRLE